MIAWVYTYFIYRLFELNMLCDCFIVLASVGSRGPRAWAPFLCVGSLCFPLTAVSACPCPFISCRLSLFFRIFSGRFVLCMLSRQRRETMHQGREGGALAYIYMSFGVYIWALAYIYMSFGVYIWALAYIYELWRIYMSVGVYI